MPGKTVAIFGGVHGNEVVGVEVVRKLAETLVLARGTVHLVEANPEAVRRGVRLVEKNLNRCFVRGIESGLVEEKRAQELMDLLDTCDVLIDIHASNTPGSPPFVICENEAMDLAALLDFGIVSSGWDAIEPGAADGYMHGKGKPALCLECGYAGDANAHQALAEESVMRVLAHLEMVDAPRPDASSAPRRHIEVYEAAIRRNESFFFAKEYADFEALKPGEVFATDGDAIYRAKEGDCIIFARPNAAIGAEAFIRGRDL